VATMGHVVHVSRVELFGEQCVLKIKTNKAPELSYKVLQPLGLKISKIITVPSRYM